MAQAKQVKTTGYGANGRPVSWIAVLVICVGFTIGGVGLCMNPPTWPIFWAGVVVTGIGIAIAFGCNMMMDFTTEEEH